MSAIWKTALLAFPTSGDSRRPREPAAERFPLPWLASTVLSPSAEHNPRRGSRRCSGAFPFLLIGPCYWLLYSHLHGQDQAIH